MAVQVITNNDSIYDYWYEDGQLYGRRKSNKVPFKINSDKANSIIFPQVQAKGVDPTKPTSTLVYHPAKYKEMPTAKKISTPKQKEETIWERGKQLINLEVENYSYFLIQNLSILVKELKFLIKK